MGCQSSCQQNSRQLETRCGREGHTRPRGPSESPDGVDPNIRRTRKTQCDGHNSGVKIWSLCSVSSTLSHANLEQPFRNLAINWEVNIFLKKSFCVFLLVSLSLCCCDAAWTCKWLYNSTPHSPKLQHCWNLTIKLFSVISRTLVGGVLPLCREAVGVFYSPSRLGKITNTSRNSVE